jgi:hypothetical protein
MSQDKHHSNKTYIGNGWLLSNRGSKVIDTTHGDDGGSQTRERRRAILAIRKSNNILNLGEELLQHSSIGAQ